MKGIFYDIDGDLSSTRIIEASMVTTTISISFISVLTGKDLGPNVADMIKFITSFVVGGCESKKGIEYVSRYLKEKNNNKNNKEIND